MRQLRLLGRPIARSSSSISSRRRKWCDGQRCSDELPADEICNLDRRGDVHLREGREACGCVEHDRPSVDDWCPVDRDTRSLQSDHRRARCRHSDDNDVQQRAVGCASSDGVNDDTKRRAPPIGSDNETGGVFGIELLYPVSRHAEVEAAGGIARGRHDGSAGLGRLVGGEFQPIRNARSQSRLARVPKSHSTGVITTVAVLQGETDEFGDRTHDRNKPRESFRSIRDRR